MDDEDRDHVAEIVEQWRRERPDLDASPILVFGRMQRLTRTVDPLLRPTFAAAGLANGDFDVLAALRRAGRPFSASPGALSAALLVTTGAITKRIDRLERRGLVQRTVSSADGRGRIVALTEEGVRLVDELIAVHVANERRVLSGLTAAEVAQLEHLLGRLASGIEQER